jgi:adenylate cyclase
MKINISSLNNAQRKLAGLVAAALVSFAVCLACFSFPSINVLEWRLADHWARQENGKTVSKTVAVVGIDEGLLDRYGWPLEKDIYGDLIDYLEDMGAAAVVFDIVFADNLDACGKGDSIFREMVGLRDNLVFSYGALTDRAPKGAVLARPKRVPVLFSTGPSTGREFPMHGAVLPYPALLAKVSHMGFNNHAKPFIDGIDRRMPLFLSQDSLLYPSLSLVTACLVDKNDKPAWNVQDGTLRIGGTVVSVDQEAHMYVNFADSIPVYTVSQMRSSQRDWLLHRSPEINREQIGGRAVFIGNTALSLGDFGVTPLSGKGAMGRSPSVLMHARVAATLLAGSAIRFHGRPAAIMISALLLVIAVLLFFWLPAYVSLPLVLGCCAAAIFSTWQFYLADRFFPVMEGVSSGVMFCILGSLVVYFEKEYDRLYLSRIFECYLSPAVINEMVRTRERPQLGGEEVYATSFFSDIEGFSKFSQDMKPSDVVASLNEYFQVMTRILLANKGTLDKFIGDAIVAFFGAPHASHSHAYDACTAAVSMQEQLAELRKKWAHDQALHETLRNLKMRIGINTGRFVTGNIGCDVRMNYTMIGDTVNLASRLEGAGKEYGVYTVVGEDTFDAVKHDFRFRLLDRIAVKGRTGPVSIYQLMGATREGDTNMLALINKYEEGLESYIAADFAKAGRLFEESLKIEKFPGLKNPSSVMLERCRHLERMMPKDWDGVFRMREK